MVRQRHRRLRSNVQPADSLARRSSPDPLDAPYPQITELTPKRFRPIDLHANHVDAATEARRVKPGSPRQRGDHHGNEAPGKRSAAHLRLTEPGAGTSVAPPPQFLCPDCDTTVRARPGEGAAVGRRCAAGRHPRSGRVLRPPARA